MDAPSVNRKDYVFRRHRDDLLAAQANERAALNKVITVLADQVEWLRWHLNEKAHMSPALHDLHTQTEAQFPSPDLPPGFDPDFNPHMSEAEEELFALRINEHITEQELQKLRGEVAKVISMPGIDFEADD